MTGGDWRFELTQVVLTQRRLEETVRFHQLSARPARLRVEGRTLLESYRPGRLGFMNERQVLSKERLPLRGSDMASREIEVPAQDYRDVTLYFARPQTPHQQWGLTVYAGTTPTGGLSVPFVFHTLWQMPINTDSAAKRAAGELAVSGCARPAARLAGNGLCRSN